MFAAVAGTAHLETKAPKPNTNITASKKSRNRQKAMNRRINDAGSIQPLLFDNRGKPVDSGKPGAGRKSRGF